MNESDKKGMRYNLEHRKVKTTINQSLNILLTSSGRRGYLVNYFKETLKGRGVVHAGNSSNHAPAFYYADKFVITPLIYDDNYVPFLLDYCIENNISVIIPLFDIDLMVLANNKSKFAELGVEVIVSEPEIIGICNDKWMTYCFCVENNIDVPKTYLNFEAVKKAIVENELQFPIMIKPRWGMGSIAVCEAENYKELEILGDKVKREIFSSYLKFESQVEKENCILYQQKLVAQEYGLDIINDLNGNYQNTIVRKKISMRSGETDCAVVVDDDEIKKFGLIISEKLGHIANLDVDVFVSDNKIYVLEMNARFGGGYPFSHMAGVNLPAAIIKWLLGESLDNELIEKIFGCFYQKDIQIIELPENAGEYKS